MPPRYNKGTLCKLVCKIWICRSKTKSPGNSLHSRLFIFLFLVLHACYFDVENLTLIPTRICWQLSSGTDFLILITMSLYPPSGDMDILLPLTTLRTSRKSTNWKCFPPSILAHATSSSIKSLISLY